MQVSVFPSNQHLVAMKSTFVTVLSFRFREK